MKKLLFLAWFLSLAFVFTAVAQGKFEKDIIKTSTGDLEITFIGHGTLMFTYNGMVIYVDPWRRLADYSVLPKADVILITHEHLDHFDPPALDLLRTKKTTVILTETCSKQAKGGIVMRNGDIRSIKGLTVDAVPAYNIAHMRSQGVPFHPKGVGNGYVITFGDKRVYIAGDTENIPEMKKLAEIDIAFLPMDLTYTMTSEMVADAARSFKPKILYPYHYSNTDTSQIVDLLKDIEQIKVRIRNMK